MTGSTMRPRSVVVLLALVVLLAQGCAGAPPSRTASKVPLTATTTPLPNLGQPPLQAAGWAGVTVRTLCLDAQLSLTDSDIETAIAQGLEHMLVGFDMDVVRAAGSCDAILTITLAGKALRAEYLPGGTCYTGYQMNGTVTLRGNGRSPVVYTIDVRNEPPGAVSGCPKTTRESSLCDAAAGQVFSRVVNLWDSSEPLEEATPDSLSLSVPTERLLVGGRIDDSAFIEWCLPFDLPSNFPWRWASPSA